MAEQVRKAIKNRDINGMFNEMCGGGVVPPNIAYTKYIRLKENLTSLTTLLENFSKGQFVKTYKEYEKSMAEILVFCHRSKKEINDTMTEPPFTEVQLIMPGQIPIKTMEAFSNTYKAAKEMAVIGQCIKTCNILLKYKPHITNKDKFGKNAPDTSFILSAPGPVFMPFSFTSFNIKEAFIRPDMTDHYRTYLMTILSMTLEYCYGIYQVYVSPDWDPEVFTQIMRANLTEVRKRIPRCDKAFDKIESSLDLLKGNMDSYYKDFVASQNPSTMMESFVNDVAMANTNTDPKTASQFRTIINQYRKMSAGKITDPRVKSLFEQVNKIAGPSMSAEKNSGADGPSTAEPEEEDDAEPDLLADLTKVEDD